MASYGHHAAPQSASKHASHLGAYGVQQMMAPGPAAPAGTFAPGTKIQVGSHRVVIQKYLSEGGFAHVYLVKLPTPVDGTDQAVLKRVAVPDKEALRGMRIEVETMKRLKGHRPIVTYIDSHASEMRGGGYEVFLLMEFCNGGGLIDFMNTRLQHRLTEPEILHIFTDITEGVACMHYIKPPLLHRDLKVENVLITAKGSNKRFKVCDFGSASPPRPAPTTVVECRLMDEDVQKHTTLQYRSPEMVDVYRKQPLNEKSDIWALGVLLYKLCYYTTPFEDQGQLAILNASYRFPSHPVFSDRLKMLIASMLKENMQSRPNIYQVLKEGCAMQGLEVPIHDIYSGRNQADQDRKDSTVASSRHAETLPVVGAVFSRPAPQVQAIPEVTPMRRGRPTASPAPGTARPQPSPSPMKTEGDPFAALDSKSPKLGEADELSSRFPTLDQFALLHDQGSKFDFDVNSPNSPALAQTPPSSKVSQRVTERLVDEVFASHSPRSHSAPRPHSVTPMAHQPPLASPPMDSLSKVSSALNRPEISRAQSIISGNPELQAISAQSTQRYVSTGTMTSSPPPEKLRREVSQGNSADVPQMISASMQASRNLAQFEATESRPTIKTRVSYQPQQSHTRQPSSSRPSLEGGRPSADFLEPGNRLDLPTRQRPASTNFESNTLEYLREREAAGRPPSRPSQQTPQISPSPSPLNDSGEDEPPRPGSSDIDFLKSLEESDKKKSSKRSSLPSLSGNKNILAGKFGDAFKRFEGNTSSGTPNRARTPSPAKDDLRRELTPIAGSEATDGRSDDGEFQEEDNMTPEMRREMERQKLEEEERRVSEAQAEYRRRVAEGGPGSGSRPIVPPKSIGGVSRVSSIQNRVQSLLNEDQKPSNIQRTAQGYGKYTDTAETTSKSDKPLPDVPRKPLVMAKPASAMNTGPSSASPALASKPPAKPPVSKKPTHLNSNTTGGQASSPPKVSRMQPGSEILIGMDLPGQPVLEMTAKEKEDYIGDFAKRYPSLGSIEMVEREIEGPPGR